MFFIKVRKEGLREENNITSHQWCIPPMCLVCRRDLSHLAVSATFPHCGDKGKECGQQQPTLKEWGRGSAPLKEHLHRVPVILPVSITFNWSLSLPFQAGTCETLVLFPCSNLTFPGMWWLCLQAQLLSWSVTYKHTEKLRPGDLCTRPLLRDFLDVALTIWPSPSAMVLLTLGEKRWTLEGTLLWQSYCSP